MFQRWKDKKKQERIALRLYREALVQARQPEFYRDYGVPDTVDGRFEMIALHVFLIIHRIGPGELSQALFDRMFIDMDHALRQMGAGDLGVPKRIKRMMKGFNGRAEAYARGIAGEEDLGDVLKRNVYGTVEAPQDKHIEAFKAYMLHVVDVLEGQTVEQIEAGHIEFTDSVDAQKAA